MSNKLSKRGKVDTRPKALINALKFIELKGLEDEYIKWVINGCPGG